MPLLRCLLQPDQYLYRYFYDKHSVVTWHFDLLADESLKQVGRTLTWRQAHVLLFDNLYKEKAVHVQANKSNGYAVTKRYAYKSTSEMYFETLQACKGISSDDSLFFQADTAALICSELTGKWCRNGMRESPQKFASLLDYVLPHQIKEIFEQNASL